MANTPIKYIQLADGQHEIYDEYARRRLEGLTVVYTIKADFAHQSTYTYTDWDTGLTVAKSAMTIKNSAFATDAEPITISGVDTGTNAYLVLASTKSTDNYYVKHMALNEETGHPGMNIGDTVYVEEKSYPDRWLSAVIESPLSAVFNTLESKIDLSEYAKKTEAGKAGAYTTSTPSVANTGSAGAETATGTATVTYKKSAEVTGEAGAATVASSAAHGEASDNTGEAGAATIQGSNFSFNGASATITSSGSYKPAGTISKPGINVSSSSVSVVNAVAEATGETGAHTHSVSVSGDITLGDLVVTPGEGTATYTPAGTLTITPTAAGTTVVVKSVSAGLAEAPTFAGTSATISISGSVSGTAVGSHSYTPEGTISAVSAASHSHAVNVSKSTVTNNVTGTATGEAGAHGHDVSVSGHAHGADVSASKINSYTAPTMTAINFTANGNDSFTAPAFTALAATATVGYVSDPTVSSSGVLKWTLNSFSAGSFTQGSKATLTGGSFNAGTFTYSGVTAAGVGSAATLTGTAASAGAHTHGLTNSKLEYVSGATTAKDGEISITPTFTGASVTLAHTVTQGSFSGSTAYTPAGTNTKPNVNVSVSTVSVNTDAIKAVSASFNGTGVRLLAAAGTVQGEMSGTAASAGAHTHSIAAAGTTVVQSVTGAALAAAPTFTGTTASIEVSGVYTPEGTISGSQTISAHSHTYIKPADHTHSVSLASHTHSIALSDATATGTAAVAVSAHTHTLSNHTHGVTISSVA